MRFVLLGSYTDTHSLSFIHLGLCLTVFNKTITGYEPSIVPYCVKERKRWLLLELHRYRN